MRSCPLRLVAIVVTASSLGAAAGCGDDADGGPAPFPEDYRSTYQEVRDCRFSLEHDLKYIRVLADPEAVEPYVDQFLPFPVGSILVKEQFGDADTSCETLVDFTVMVKLTLDAAPEDLDWSWYHVSGAFRIVREDVKGCPKCHIDCGFPPMGYDGTCTMP